MSQQTPAGYDSQQLIARWHPESERWILWIGDYTYPVTFTSATRGDGVEVQVEPYQMNVTNNGQKVLGYYHAGIWSREEVEAAGGRIVDPLEIPEGKQIVQGTLTLVEHEGQIKWAGKLEDVPEKNPASIAMRAE